MSTYFKPLRRKIGVPTLGLACLCMGAWTRSVYLLDEFSFAGTSSLIRVDSIRGGIVLIETRPKPKRGINSNWWLSAYLVHDEPRYPPVFGWELDAVRDRNTDRVSVWQMSGFTFSEQMLTGENVRILIVPYWSIVLPLTVLSAWLLLSMPRAEKIEPTV